MRNGIFDDATINPLAKANPNHDEKGRFSSGDGAAPGKTDAAVNAWRDQYTKLPKDEQPSAHAEAMVRGLYNAFPDKQASSSKDYIDEAESGDGHEYWDQFSTTREAASDFREYQKNAD